MTPAVVIVTCLGGALLARCLEALRAQSLSPGRVIVVVSADGPVHVPDGVEVIELGRRRGFAFGANAGLRAAAPAPVVLLNDDTVPAPTFIEQLAAAAASGGEGLYQPRILLADGSERLDNTGHRLFPDGFNLARDRGRRVGPRTGEIGAFSGAAVLLTPGVLAAVGLFDEDLGAFGEDVDLSLRARRRGFRIRHVADAEIAHVLGASYGRSGPRKVFAVERNRLRLAVRSLPASAVLTMPGWTALRLGALAAAALAGRGIGAGVGPAGVAAAAAGAAAGLWAVPDALGKRRTDRRGWTVGEWGMWAHLLRHHVRPADLLGRA